MYVPSARLVAVTRSSSEWGSAACTLTPATGVRSLAVSTRPRTTPRRHSRTGISEVCLARLKDFARRAGGKKWDMAILSVVGLLTLAKHVIAGFDFRFGWSAGIPPAVQVVALVVAALGYALGTWAMAVNAFFSLVVRIQDDRGHTVASSGPYRYVRHPGYLGTVVFELVTPLMLGSWWALIPGGLGALLMVIRTALEDRDLQAELAGYDEYARKVRYRLLPGVW